MVWVEGCETSARFGFYHHWELRDSVQYKFLESILCSLFEGNPGTPGNSRKWDGGIEHALGKIQPECLTLVVSQIKAKDTWPDRVGGRNGSNCNLYYIRDLGALSHREKLTSKHKRFLKCLETGLGNGVINRPPRKVP